MSSQKYVHIVAFWDHIAPALTERPINSEDDDATVPYRSVATEKSLLSEEFRKDKIIRNSYTTKAKEMREGNFIKGPTSKREPASDRFALYQNGFQTVTGGDSTDDMSSTYADFGHSGPAVVYHSGKSLKMGKAGAATKRIVLNTKQKKRVTRKASTSTASSGRVCKIPLCRKMKHSCIQAPENECLKVMLDSRVPQSPDTVT
eukprot:Nk52_evm15s248 gene=Nk52_evmTU15s248